MRYYKRYFYKKKIHNGFFVKVIPKLNPWPYPNSIVIMTNAKIPM